jgi:hypothetical protein
MRQLLKRSARPVGVRAHRPRRGFMLGLAVLAAAVGTAVFASGTSASADSSLSGTFVAHFGRGLGASNGSCPAQTFCGTGTLSSFGSGTQLTEFTSFEPIDDTPCANVTIVQTITVAAGTLVLDEGGLFCSPGASDGAPSSPSDYGHPHTIQLTYTVDGASTGVFSGATGSGSESVVIAGDVGTSNLSGTIALTS